jgi:hypothetical protein
MDPGALPSTTRAPSSRLRTPSETLLATWPATFSILGHALAGGCSPHDLLDSIDDTRYSYYALLNPRNHRLRASVIKETGSTWLPRVLSIDAVEVVSSRRGQRLGLRCARSIIHRHRSCHFVALKPGNLNPEYGRPGTGGVTPDESRIEQMARNQFDENLAERKLRAYWSQLGFRRVAKTDIYIMRPEAAVSKASPSYRSNEFGCDH